MSTNENIIFATDTYCEYGSCYSKENPITLEILKGFTIGLQPRISRDKKEQIERTRSKAEVYTSAWLCNKMINYCDNDWFNQENIFNIESPNDWNTTLEPIKFVGKSWTDYVLSKRLEVACGEAPYLTSRYGATDGIIIPIENRIGLLDRKLRIVNENTSTQKKWFKWVKKAYQSIYGYEFQGDSLLIARINLLQTFIDNLNFKWHREPTKNELNTIAEIISWNVWQMDGLTDCIPYGSSISNDGIQLSLFDIFEEPSSQKDTSCYIKDWQEDKEILFKTLKERSDIMKFDFVIGNPPYQDQSNGEKKADASIYNYFMDVSYKISDKVELITPARFLFNNGNTPTQWNNKMLSDIHFKVLYYEQDSSKVFSNTDIKGGVVITYRDTTKNFGAIETFSLFEELNYILKKVKSVGEKSLMDIIYNQNKFKLDVLYSDYHSLKSIISSDGKEKRMTSGCITYDCFHDNEEDEDIKILGVSKNKRVYKFINKKYVEMDNTNINGYKVIVPANNGSGAIGEVLSTPLIGTPLIGYTQTFISIGNCNNQSEAENILKYIKGKFSRTMLGILKITQNGKKPVWKYVPLQDFTSNSDIDWNTSIANIDKQLYKK